MIQYFTTFMQIDLFLLYCQSKKSLNHDFEKIKALLFMFDLLKNIHIIFVLVLVRFHSCLIDFL
jgi:hypothetical protein